MPMPRMGRKGEDNGQPSRSCQAELATPRRATARTGSASTGTATCSSRTPPPTLLPSTHRERWPLRLHGLRHDQRLQGRQRRLALFDPSSISATSGSIPFDLAVSPKGHFLYNLASGSKRARRVLTPLRRQLTPTGAATGLPASNAGLAAGPAHCGAAVARARQLSPSHSPSPINSKLQPCSGLSDQDFSGRADLGFHRGNDARP
jgi:hypothetical protein